MTLEERAALIATRQDLALFLQELVRDLEAHPEHWENATLSRFLEAAAAWLVDTTADKATTSGLSYKELAELMLAARIYE